MDPIRRRDEIGVARAICEVACAVVLTAMPSRCARETQANTAAHSFLAYARTDVEPLFAPAQAVPSERIIVDDNSCDGTFELCEKLSCIVEATSQRETLSTVFRNRSNCSLSEYWLLFLSAAVLFHDYDDAGDVVA